MEAGHYSMNQFAHPNYAMNPQHPSLESTRCQLTVRQQPKIGRVALGEEKNRKPIDPPPIVQLRINRDADPEQSYLQSPYFFVSCNLVRLPGSHDPHPLGTSLAGTLVSSLHRLKDSDNAEGAFFIFGDLSVKLEGIFALQFNLYEMREKECSHVLSILSEGFPVHGPKNFPGLSESTTLTRSFSDQGVRLRVRKEPRSLLRKRGPASDNYVPRSYNRQRLHQEMSEEQIGKDDSPISSQHSQHEQQASIQSSQQMDPGRDYPQQPFGMYTDDTAIKRSRADSEQNQQQRYVQESQEYAYAQQSHQIALGHQRPAQLSPSYVSYNAQSQQQQQQGFGYPYTPGESYSFPQQGSITPGSQQSTPTNFPQSHSLYPQVPHYGGQFSPQVLQSTNSPYGMGAVDGSRRSGMDEMVPSRFSRTASLPGYIPAIGGERRTSYGAPGHTFTNQNISAVIGVGSSRSPSVQPPITTGPGSMDNTYQ